jgi:hypothetical protein
MIRISSHRLPFSLSIGSAAPVPPIALGELFEIYYYDRDRALGSVAGGLLLLFVWQSAQGSVTGASVQAGPDQDSAIGSVAGGTLFLEPTRSPQGSVVGANVQAGPDQDGAVGAIGSGTVQAGPNQASAIGTISGGVVLPPEYAL